MARSNIPDVKELNVVMLCELPHYPKVAREIGNLLIKAFDFLNLLKARIKIYARSYDLTFANFKEIYTLGGKLCT